MGSEATVGAQVRKYRLGREWTQEDLAERLGVHRVYISRIETGAVGVSASTLVRLAIALGVSTEALAAPLYIDQGRR